MQMNKQSFNTIILLSVLFLFSTCKSPVEVELYGEINGVVTDAISKQPLQGALVSMSPDNMSTLTGSDGKYSFKRLDPKDYKIQVSLEGYTTNTKNATVKAGEAISGDISLISVQPNLEVDQLLLDFGDTYTQMPLVISNSGKGELDWNIIENIPWLSVNPTLGKTTVQKASIIITIDRTALSVGSYTQQISITSNGGTKVINVSMNVPDPFSPKLTIGSAFNVTTTEATISGNCLSAGTGTIIKHGHCYSTIPGPDISNYKTDLGPFTSTGSYNSTIIGLEKSKTYFIRAYATNSLGYTGYSTQVTFTTSEDLLKANLTIQESTNITSNSALANGGIAGLGNSNIIDYGHCWSVNREPKLTDSKTSLGGRKSTGIYSSNLNGLLPGTTYYIRAYATNNAGTAYSSEMSITTLPSPIAPTVSSGSVNDIMAFTATVDGSVESIGTDNITQYGHCWSTVNTPTTNNSKSQLGTKMTIGAFSSSLSGLGSNTTYYVRAYASNSAGTAYGNIISFTTKSPPILTTTSVTSILQSSASSGGSISSDGGLGITTRGVCWSTIRNPTISDSKTSDGTGTGGFTSSISKLSPTTTYYVRAYATNAAGTAYGNELTFTSADFIPAPTLTLPTNGNAVSCCYLTFEWSKITNSTSYEIQVSKNQNFIGSQYTLSSNFGPNSSGVNIATVTDNVFYGKPGGSSENGTWYWRVRAIKGAMTSDWSAINSYTYTY